MEAPTFFSTGVVPAKVLLQVVSKCGYPHGYLAFSCVFCTHVITQTRHHDRSSGRQRCQRNKIRKYKRWQRKEILTKRLLENQQGRKKKQGTRSCCLTKLYQKMQTYACGKGQNCQKPIHFYKGFQNPISLCFQESGRGLPPNSNPDVYDLSDSRSQKSHTLLLAWPRR